MIRPTFQQLQRSNYKQHPRYSGVVFHAMCNEGGGTLVYDASGYGNTGTLGGATLPVWGTSLVGASLNGNATSGVVTLSDVPVLRDIAQKTVCMRCSITDAGGASLGRIIQKRATGGWDINLNNVQVTFGIEYSQNFSTTNGDWVFNSIVSGTSYNPPAVQTLVLTYDNTSVSNNPVLYVNGMAVNATALSAPVGTAASDSGTTLYLLNDGSGARGGNLQLVDLRVYNRILAMNDILSYTADPYLEFRGPAFTLNMVTAIVSNRAHRLLLGVG